MTLGIHTMLQPHVRAMLTAPEANTQEFSLADPCLPSLPASCPADAPWSDLYIPLPDPGGPGGLQELVLRDCHLPAAPDALASVAGSLTLLSICMCEGYAEQQGE